MSQNDDNTAFRQLLGPLEEEREQLLKEQASLDALSADIERQQNRIDALEQQASELLKTLGRHHSD
ncbi:MAG: hypothetical protein AAF465_05690 [Pseudomonadota bacterium]